MLCSEQGCLMTVLLGLVYHMKHIYKIDKPDLLLSLGVRNQK